MKGPPPPPAGKKPSSPITGRVPPGTPPPRPNPRLDLVERRGPDLGLWLVVPIFVMGILLIICILAGIRW